MKLKFLRKYRGTFTERYINMPSKLEVFSWVCMWIGFIWMLLWGFELIIRGIVWLASFT
jgi:hypothetical protein